MPGTLIARIKSRLPHWNRQVLTESYFFDFCKNNGILYGETDLISGAGEYLIHRNRDFILINTHCGERFKNWVRYHELAHFLFHVPGRFDNTMRRKFDYEANVIASVALIPLCVIKKYTWAQIKEFYDYPMELYLIRLMVYEKYGI
jgi:Zn-dependent peptidase ImmA (M78 family)